MTDTQQPRHRHGATLQTKALAGLVAVMLAAAIVALVFVSSGGGSKNHQAGGPASDVGRNSTATTSNPSPTRPAGTSTASSPKSAPSTTSTPKTSSTQGPSKTTTSSHASDTKKVIYTVKKGDTLFDIGRWYSDHGYLKLYNWNKSVIGKNPNLIFPGQKIIVVDGHVGVARHHR